MKGHYITLVRVYVPTMNTTEKCFAKKLPRLIRFLVILTPWSGLVKHSVGKRNSNGLLLFQLCEKLVVH